FRADTCHNVDRLMRLPGTVNIPNKKKASKGRKRALASLVVWNGTRYPVTAFEKLKTPATGTTGMPPTASRKPCLPATLGKGAPMGTEELRAWGEANGKSIADETSALIATGDASKWNGNRSSMVFRVLCDLVRAGVPNDMLMDLLLDRANVEFSSHMGDQKGDLVAYARRQIERAHEKAIDPRLRELNEQHAVLLQEGGKTRVLSWERTELDKTRLVPVLQSFEDFRNRYMHKFVVIPTDKGVGHKPMGKWWLEHPQ